MFPAYARDVHNRSWYVKHLKTHFGTAQINAASSALHEHIKALWRKARPNAKRFTRLVATDGDGAVTVSPELNINLRGAQVKLRNDMSRAS